ncbi:MAG: carbonic anhydrase [Bacteroidales bacterium]|nr:carbonic anhydrase [Bacteroidales bacterium]
MKKITLMAATLMMAGIMASCRQGAPVENNAQLAIAQNAETHVLHAKDVDPLTPDSVINILKAGNAAFVAKQTTNRDAVAQLQESSKDGQHPLAIVLSCIDARVPVEIIFDKGVGDIFVTRVAGNVVSGDVLGSMEYACEHSGSKVVVVMGHKQCGAVHSACANVQAGNMTDMLAKIKPAIEELKNDSTDVEDPAFQNEVARENAMNMVDEVRKGSEILTELEKEGKVKVVPALFDLETGVVEFL